MRLASIILFACISAFGQDLYVNFEDVAAGTPASLSVMGTISHTNGNAVTFSYVGTSTGISIENQTSFPGLLRPVTVAGVPYTNTNPTKALYVRPDVGGDGNLQKLMWTYAPSRKVSCGFSVTMTNFGSAATDYYNCGGYESGATYGVVSMVADGSVPYIQSETIAGTGAHVLIGGNGISTLTIWVTTLWDSANSKYICAFYNQTNMALMGFSTMPTTLNATVNTMGFGSTGAHTFAAGENFWLNNLILYTNGTVWPVWPGNNLQCPTNATDTAVTAAIALASAGDQVVLPATNLTWNSGVTVNKQLVIRGLGLNKTNCLLNVGNAVTAWTLSGNFITISNLYNKGTKPAVSGNYQNTGFDIVGQNNRVCYTRTDQMQIGLYDRQWGCADHNMWLDNTKFRSIWSGGTMNEATVFGTYYPQSFASTNSWHWEADQFWITPDCNTNGTGGIGYFSSQQSASWTFRHCSLVISNSSILFAPLFDMHGDDSSGGLPRPAMQCQIYDNDFYFLLYANNFAGKFADMRGTHSAIYNNRIWQISNPTFDHEIAYREERPTDFLNYLVYDSYAFNNRRGASATTAMTITDDTNITAGVDYFLTEPGLYAPDPHQLRNESVVYSPPVSIGPPRIRSIRLVQ